METTNRQIESFNLSAFLKEKDVFVLDVRTPQEFASGALEHANLIPIDDLQNRMAELPKSLDTKILVYCAHGVRSEFGKSLLEKHGYKNVFNLAGGLASLGHHHG